MKRFIYSQECVQFILNTIMCRIYIRCTMTIGIFESIYYSHNMQKNKNMTYITEGNLTVRMKRLLKWMVWV